MKPSEWFETIYNEAAGGDLPDDDDYGDRILALLKAVEEARKSTLTPDHIFWGVDEDVILAAALALQEIE